jgi:hypothetical protein
LALDSGPSAVCSVANSLEGCEKLTDATKPAQYFQHPAMKVASFLHHLPPLGETREREQALKITFSTAC